MNRLKKEFNKRFEVINEPSIAHFLVNDSNFHKTVGSQQLLNEIWNWINQNYISKEQILNLECLKEESGEFDQFLLVNQLRNEIKKEIEKL